MAVTAAAPRRVIVSLGSRAERIDALVALEHPASLAARGAPADADYGIVGAQVVVAG